MARFVIKPVDGLANLRVTSHFYFVDPLRYTHPLMIYASLEMRLKLILACLMEPPPTYRHLAPTYEASPRLTEAEDQPLCQMPPIFWMIFRPWWSQGRQQGLR